VAPPGTSISSSGRPTGWWSATSAPASASPASVRSSSATESSPGFQRQGYAREAVAALIGHLAAEHAIHRFVAVAAEANAASRAVLHALGFRQEGSFKRSFLCNGEWLDDAYYALLAEEWRARRG
jgi:RimJ/RimL family protein N-acetyltransferase